MARERTQQSEQRADRHASTTSTSGTAGSRSQSQEPDRERSITTNREQTRQGPTSTGMTRPPGASVSRQGRAGGFEGPFALMQRMADDMDRLFEQFGLGRSMGGLSSGFGSLIDRDPWSTSGLASLPSQTLWAPEVDLVRRGDKLVVRADVPGMNKEDLHVDVEDNVITIRGERREAHEDHDEGVFRSERSYGQFYRAIPLPEGVNADQCEATYENGVLEVTLQAPEQERASRRIPIR